MQLIRGIYLAVTAAAIVGALAQPVGAQTPPTYANLFYGFDHFRQNLDIYIPDPLPDTCGPLPLVIYVYGGGWLVGEKEDVAPYVDALLSRGMAVASINHRYSYQATFPAQIHDCKGAIRFLRANAAKYGIDPDRFAIFGDSSGGHLASLVGTSAGVAEVEGTVGDDLDQPTNVQIVGDFYGVVDLIAQGTVWNSPDSTVSQLIGHPIQDVLNNIDNPDPPYPELVALLLDGTPGTHVDPKNPPFHIVHGMADDQVDPSQAVNFDAALQAAGVPSTLTLIKGAGHGLPLEDYLPVFDAFGEVLAGPPPVVGDLDCDGHVNVSDLIAVIQGWGDCLKGKPCADANGDGAVDVNDLITVILNWTG